MAKILKWINLQFRHHDSILPLIFDFIIFCSMKTFIWYPTLIVLANFPVIRNKIRDFQEKSWRKMTDLYNLYNI